MKCRRAAPGHRSSDRTFRHKPFDSSCSSASPSGIQKARGAGALDRCFLDALGMNRSVGQRIEAGYVPAPADRHQHHFLALARFETPGGAGGDVEAHAERSRAIECQRAVRFEEMKMAADLDRS